MGLKELAKLVKESKEDRGFTDDFVHHYYKALISAHPPRTPKVDMFSPSSLNKCPREIYYRIMGYEPEPQQTPVHLSGSWKAIMENGTDRHERIQETITKIKEEGMDIEWVDVAEFVEKFKPEGTTVIEKQGMETKLFSTILSARFLSDGLIKYKDNYYIIEIKTMNERKWNTAAGRGTMNEEHVMQASAYSIALGVDDVLYIYENRNNSQILVFQKHINEQLKKAVIHKIKYVQEYKKIGAIPPKCKDYKACMYCEYKNRCSRDGFTPELFKGVDFSDEQR